MKQLLLLLILFGLPSPKAKAFEVLQKSKDAKVVSQGSSAWPTEIESMEGEVKLRLNGDDYDIFKSSELHWVSSEEARLSAGSVRFRHGSDVPFRWTTPVALVSLGTGDYFVEYLPAEAIVRVFVIEGTALLQGHYRDEVLNLQAKEKGEFVGMPSSEGPLFDFLLQGRKAIRGHLAGPMVLDAAELKDVTELKTIKYNPSLIKQKPRPKPGQICAEPFAKFNECVWQCRDKSGALTSCLRESPKSQCVRERCMANGRWGDRQILKGPAALACAPNGAKTSQLRVAPCDY